MRAPVRSLLYLAAVAVVCVVFLVLARVSSAGVQTQEMSVSIGAAATATAAVNVDGYDTAIFSFKLATCAAAANLTFVVWAYPASTTATAAFEVPLTAVRSAASVKSNGDCYADAEYHVKGLAFVQLRVTNSDTVARTATVWSALGREFPATQAVSGTVTATGTVNVGNLPATQPVSGTVAVSNLPATQAVSGTVAVSNLPATQPVSGTVSVSNLPATQPVSGTVSVGNFPSSYAVTGTVDVGNEPFVKALACNAFTTSNPPACDHYNSSMIQANNGVIATQCVTDVGEPELSNCAADRGGSSSGTVGLDPAANTVQLDPASTSRFNLVWWGVWAVVGLALAGLILPPIFSRFKFGTPD